MRQGKHIFYGWWVVLGLFFSTFLGAWGRFILSTLAPAITKDTGWVTSQIMLSITIALFVYAISLLFVGRLIDNIGGKQVISIGSICLIVGFVLLSLVRELWQLYLVHGILLAIAVSMVHTVPTQAVARKWFIKQTAFVAGLLTAAFSLSQAILAPLLTQSAASFGWQTSCLICTSFGAVILILARFVIKDTPESEGLQPYGAEENKIEASSNIISEVSISIPPRQALRTVPFWALCLAMGFVGIPLQGFLTNLVVWGADITGDPATAGLFVTAFSLPSMFGKILWGWLGDKLGKRKIGIISAALCGVVLIAAWLWVNSAQSLYVMCILFGLVWGGNVVIIFPYMGDLFGRASVGTLIGYATAAHGFLGAAGPILWSAIFDATGAYNIAALVSAGMYLLIVICFILARPLSSTGTPKG